MQFHAPQHALLHDYITTAKVVLFCHYDDLQFVITINQAAFAEAGQICLVSNEVLDTYLTACIHVILNQTLLCMCKIFIEFIILPKMRVPHRTNIVL